MAPIRVQSLEYPASTKPRMRTKTNKCRYVLKSLESATFVSRERASGCWSSSPNTSPSEPDDALTNTTRLAGRHTLPGRGTEANVVRDRCFRPDETRAPKGCRARRRCEETTGARARLGTRDTTADTGNTRTKLAMARLTTRASVRLTCESEATKSPKKKNEKPHSSNVLYSRARIHSAIFT
jgi:hypothetical protein